MARAFVLSAGVENQILTASVASLSLTSHRRGQALRMLNGSASRGGRDASRSPSPVSASFLPARRRRPPRPIVDPHRPAATQVYPRPRGESDPAQPSSILFHSPLICLPHANPLSHTTSHPFASLAGSRRHRGRHVVGPPLSRMWAPF